MKPLENPFPVTTYYGPEYFCDRDEDKAHLISLLRSGNSITLTSIRRIGKTGLIHHLLHQLPSDWRGVYIDILTSNSMKDFLDMLSTAIMTAIPEQSSFGEKLWNLIKMMRPVIEFDALSGDPQVTFNIKQNEAENNINTIFQFLEKQDFRVVIAIDEFQQITKYEEENCDAWLRSKIQQLKNVFFIFSGSQQQLMSELFSSPSRPFFRSTTIIELKKIDAQIYKQFIIDQFQKYDKRIPEDVVDELIEWTDCHTFYVQQLCNRLFTATQKEATSELWKQEAHLLLKEQDNLFFSYRSLLTTPQWKLLRAIGQEGDVFAITSGDFIAKYRLGSSATVLRSLKTLLEADLVIFDYNLSEQKDILLMMSISENGANAILFAIKKG